MTPTATRPRKTPLFETEPLWIIEFKMVEWVHWQRAGDYSSGELVLVCPMSKARAEEIATERQRKSLSLIYRVREIEPC